MNKGYKLTKKLQKEFFNLIKDEEVDNSVKVAELINDFPELANAFTAALIPSFSKHSIASLNAPTPGRMILSNFSTSSAFLTTYT